MHWSGSADVPTTPLSAPEDWQRSTISPTDKEEDDSVRKSVTKSAKAFGTSF
jgi:hypothetical protein